VTIANTTSDHFHALAKLRDIAKQQRYRYLVCISGSRDWAINWITTYLQNASPENSLCVSDQDIAELSVTTHDKIATFLGHEFDSIIYDAFSGFYPNTFSIMEGTLSGGGLFFLLTPELDDWPHYRDHFCHDYAMYPLSAENMETIFINRLERLLRSDKTISRISETEAAYIHEPTASDVQPQQKPVDPPYKTTDQRVAVEAICQLHDANYPLVLLSRRGYGKSSALGIAAALLVQQAKKQIIITAPRRTAVNRIFEHAASSLAQTLDLNQSLLMHEDARIEFIAPDELIRHPRQVSLLIIDEAAAIPVSMLQQLLKHYPNAILSSTVFGYEGHGRGFEIQFLKYLDQHYSGWKLIELQQPIRWELNDPLESFSARAFLYHAIPPMVNSNDEVALNAIEMHEFDKHQLHLYEPLFTLLFNLLNSAHYKTSPDDLRIILDSPSIRIFYLLYNSTIIACSLIVYEGGIPSGLAEQVIRGERRIKGQILPQTLLGNVVNPDIAAGSFARIMRIAVVPELQQRGIGSLFLKKLKEHHLQKVDYLGASFGAQSDLIEFWKKSDYLALRLGRKPNAFTGRYPLLMIQSLSKKGQNKLLELQQDFAARFMYLLSDSYRNLPCQLAITLIAHLSPQLTVKISANELKEVKLFSDSHRQYDSSVAAIHQFMIEAIQKTRLSDLAADLQSILIKKFIQKQTDEIVIEQHQLAGNAELVKLLREGVRDLLKDYEGTVKR
jgi:tRNA(Met) cytidine acetyltransferase